MYEGLGATNANILVGILSAIVDNIPVMFAVLTMNPPMPLGTVAPWSRWTVGVAGSLSSIWVRALCALMGTAPGEPILAGPFSNWLPSCGPLGNPEAFISPFS